MPERVCEVFQPSRDAVIHVPDEADNVIETHEHIGHFKEPYRVVKQKAATP